MVSFFEYDLSIKIVWIIYLNNFLKISSKGRRKIENITLENNRKDLMSTIRALT